MEKIARKTTFGQILFNFFFRRKSKTEKKIAALIKWRTIDFVMMLTTDRWVAVDEWWGCWVIDNLLKYNCKYAGIHTIDKRLDGR